MSCYLGVLARLHLYNLIFLCSELNVLLCHSYVYRCLKLRTYTHRPGPIFLYDDSSVFTAVLLVSYAVIHTHLSREGLSVQKVLGALAVLAAKM